MLSAALLEARRRGAEVFPVLAVDFVARGLSLGRGVYSPAERVTGLGQVTAVTRAGGWAPIEYGSGIGESKLEVVRTSVDVSDPDGALLRMLQTYDPRGSAARIDWGASGLEPDDWEPTFRGVLEDWAAETPYTRLIMKTDDTALRAIIPPAVFLQTEWGSAYDATIFGTHWPLCFGVLDSFQVTIRGAVPLVNIRYDKDQGYWWAVSAGHTVEVARLYYDGVLQGDLGWSVRQRVFGRTLATVLVIEEGYQPEKEVIVSVDVRGPDEAGGSTGSTLTGAPDILRAGLQELAFRLPPLAGWRGPHELIHAESWDSASEYFALHGIEAALRLGADQDGETAAEWIQSYLDVFRFARIYWNALGQLEHAIIDPDDVDPEDELHLELDKHHDGEQLPYEPADEREVYTHINMPYLWSPAEQKFMAAYEAVDVAALPLPNPLTIDNRWSQGRFTRGEDPLNPAPPDDPEIPT